MEFFNFSITSPSSTSWTGKSINFQKSFSKAPGMCLVQNSTHSVENIRIANIFTNRFEVSQYHAGAFTFSYYYLAIGYR